MRQIPVFLTAALLAAPALAFGKKAVDQASDSTALIEEMKTAAVDKKRVEAYVKRRLAKISDHHKARMDFMAKEADTWNAFWGKVRDERRLFEIRLSRQTLDFFESLSSIAGADHDGAIADFEKLQGSVITSFETQQRQKLDDFFSARDQRWKDFAAQQQQERSQFMADAPSDWRSTRQNAALPTAKASAEDGDEAVQDAPAAASKARR